MKVLRNHLQEIRSQIVSVSIPGEGGLKPHPDCPVTQDSGLLMWPSWFAWVLRGPNTKCLPGRVLIALLWGEEGGGEKQGDI